MEDTERENYELRCWLPKRYHNTHESQHRRCEIIIAKQ